MKNLRLFVLACFFVLGGCSHLSNPHYLMCGADFEKIKDKNVGVILLGIAANLGANYAANQSITLKVVIPFGDKNNKIKNEKDI